MIMDEVRPETLFPHAILCTTYVGLLWRALS